MLRYLFAALSLGVSAITFPTVFSENREAVHDAAVIARDAARSQSAKQQVSTQEASAPRLSGTERIARDRGGHYVAEFQLNNTRVDGMIDTGASAIAINRTTASRAGIRLSDADFVYTVNTANGQTRAAKATLNTVRIGSIRVDQVEAIVLDDQALDGVLIGMSFMNRLRGFEYANGSLVLRR
ncbi:MAG: TIGR02281 family clan AA aspartic protease [Ahrensia sp.]